MRPTGWNINEARSLHLVPSRRTHDKRYEALQDISEPQGRGIDDMEAWDQLRVIVLSYKEVRVDDRSNLSHKNKQLKRVSALLKS